jgi:CHAD domain-containing protein
LEIKALDHYHASGDMILPFKKHLLKEEKLARKKMIRAVKKTDIKKFRNIEKKIKMVCSKISTREFLDKTFVYILFETGKIRNLFDTFEGSGKMHKIRQHLKSIGNVIVLIRPVLPGKKPEPISRKIKAIDNLIGSYHDHFILMTTLEKFIENQDEADSETVSSLRSFSQMMRNENEVLLESLNPKINSTLTIILRNLTELIRR